jgi:two-component system sensor histidine kinase DesK
MWARRNCRSRAGRRHVPEGRGAPGMTSGTGRRTGGAGRLPPSMKINRLPAIALGACVAVMTTLTAMSMVSDAADAQWHSLFGWLVRTVAAAFTSPPSFNSAGSDRAVLAHRLYLWGYAASNLLFAVLFRLRTNGAERRPAPVNAAMLGLQLAIGVAVEANLLYVFAAELALVLAPRDAVRWLAAMLVAHAAQSFAIVVAEARNDQGAGYGLLAIGLETVFFVFAFGIAALAVLEQRARLGLAASHAELLATHALLADTARGAERLRIARELHDSIGHHLTALNLHLDLADRQLTGTNGALRTARELARDLLGEVRAVVSDERGGQVIDLGRSLRTLCDGIPGLPVRLEVQPGLRIASPLAAHALFRCIQEAISNTLKHAGARQLSVAVGRRGATIAATIQDDGRGARGRAEGNGLAGMRERMQALGGAMATRDLPQGGFEVALSVPAIEGAR